MGLSKILWVTLIMGGILVIAVGCSGGGVSPVAPEDNTSNQTARNYQECMMPDGRILWGAWDIGIDPLTEKIDVALNREINGHYDVKSYLLPPACNNCIIAKFKGTVGLNIYKIDITLKNPTGLTGYDVRGTVLNKGVIELRNPDSYTFIFAPPTETSPRPFVAYDTGPGRPFFPYSSHTEEFHLFNLFHPDYATINYVVDASWPANCKEPYAVTNCQATGAFTNDGSNTASIYTDVYDWQDDVQSVWVDLTALGGEKHANMTHTTGNTWVYYDAFWKEGGYLSGQYKALVTAMTAGTTPKKETYNYVTITITTPGGGGEFVCELPNWELTGEHAPGTCLDLAVVGDDEGASYTLVVGPDGNYHYWDSTYAKGEGYVGYTSNPHEPIVRLDTASLATPEALDTWAWLEVNNDPDPKTPGDTPPQDAPIAYWAWIWWWWDHDPENPGPDPGVSGWILYQDPDPGPPIATYTRPFDACGGFARDGMQYWGSKYASGDETLYPYIAVYGFTNPYDAPESFAFAGLTPQGSGDGKVDRTSVNGLDVDDMEGYSNVYCVFSEKAPEEVVEVFQFDFIAALSSGDYDMTPFSTIHPTNEPIDVEILPMKNLAKDSNWICVLTAANEVEVYKVSDGSFVMAFGGSPYIAGEARYLDVDDLNYKVHVMQDGPKVSVFYYKPG